MKPRDAHRVTKASASSWVVEASWYETDGLWEQKEETTILLWVYSRICFPSTSQDTLPKMQI